MTPFKQNLPRRQRGIITAMAAVVLIAAVLYVLSQSFGIIGKTSQSNTVQRESVAAFFHAESGLELAFAKIRDAAIPTSSAACTSLNNLIFSLEIGALTTVTTESLGCTDDVCTQCRLTSTGTFAGASRTVILEVNLHDPSGGAIGCGGGGGGPPGCSPGNPTAVPAIPPDACYDPTWVDPVNCSGVTAPYLNAIIAQNITIGVDEAPAALVSNVAYKQLPGRSVNFGDCVTVPLGTGCSQIWASLSNTTGTGGVSVGSRGAGQENLVAGPYEFKQTLTNDTYYAAVGLKVGALDPAAPVDIIGAYWDDTANGDTTKSNANNDFTGGTNNGTLCTAPGTPNTTTCPNDEPVPGLIPSSGSQQASRSWCYGADTIILGFSGNSRHNLNGTVTSFSFGTSPAGFKVAQSEFPEPDAATSTESEIFSAVWYVHNPAYDSAAPTTSGSVFTGGAGVPAVTAAVDLAPLINSGTTSATLTLPTNTRIYFGDKLNAASNTGGGCNAGQLVATITRTACYVTSEPVDGCATTGSYQFSAAACKSGAGDTEVRSSNLRVNALTGWISQGDQVIGATPGTLVAAITNTTCDDRPYTCDISGPNVIYPLNQPAMLAHTTTNQTNGYTVHTTATTLPVAGSVIESREPALGRIANSTSPYDPACVSIPSPISPATSFESKFFHLRAHDGQPWDNATSVTRCEAGSFRTPSLKLAGAKLCAGICAFFNHTSQTAVTPFTVNHTGTSQWAAGLTCLSGVDTGEIQGMTANSADPTRGRWTELIK